MSRYIGVRRFVRPLCLATLGFALASGVAACGGEDASEQQAQTEAITRAKAEGRRDALNEQRLTNATRATKRLQAKVDKLERTRSAPPASRAAHGDGSSVAPLATATAGTSCGDGVTVNSTTSCPFARNVQTAYEATGGARILQVDSPVTGGSYTMTCAPGIPTVCSGGDNAKVYIR